MLRILYTFVVLVCCFILPGRGLAQSGVCDNNTPFFIADLSGNPDTSYISPSVVRKGRCCGEVGPPPPRCIEFEITLHPDALGIAFDFYSGAEPTGAMYYQINCGDPIPVGEPVCLSGVGPHTLTFCKPGSNQNEYTIISFGPQITAPDEEVRAGCETIMMATGFLEPTIQWTDITSGTGAYDAYLSCTSGCASTTVNPDYFAPSVIEYQVCGDVVSTICQNIVFHVCDTVRVDITPGFTLNLPDTVSFCNTVVNKFIEITPDQPDYTYYYFWNGGSLTTDNTYEINQPGTYTVVVVDSAWANCSRDSITYLVEFFSAQAEIIEPNPICPGESTVFEAANVDPDLFYQWEFGAGAVPSSAIGPGPHNVSFSDCGEYPVILNADDNGCPGADTLYFQVIDDTAPVFTSPPANITVDCNSIPAITNISVLDDCDDNVDTTFSQVILGSGCSYTIQRTWTAEDECGNTSQVTQEIAVEDQNSPNFDWIPADVTVLCGEVPTVQSPTATDECDNNVNITLLQDTLKGFNCPVLYVVQRTWTATDVCGNSDQATQLITVEEHSGPDFDWMVNDTTVLCGEVFPGSTPSVSDNCGFDVLLTFVEDTLATSDCPAIYIVRRTWTATDVCGNTNQATRLITVEDHTAPVLTGLPADVTVNCADPLPDIASPSLTDDCDATTSLDYNEETTPADCAGNYELRRIWTATDGCGNSEQFTQTITIEDNTAPVLTGLPADVTVNCADPLPDIASPSLTDDCDATTSLDYNEETTPADCAGNYELRRIWTATDGCGNSEQFTQTITIEDNTAPVLTGLPADVTVNCADPLPDIASPSLTDDCDATTSLDYNEETTPADCAGNYELRRIWTATDGCGNSEQFTQTITIEDNTAPVLTGLPADVTVNCADPLPDIASPSLTDDCDATTSLDYNEETTPADCAGNYELRRIWTATDGCGNSEQFTQTITIEDNTAPVLTGLPADVTVNCADPLPDIASPSLTDDCDATTSLDYNEETTPADCAGNYELRRIWTATDGCGNSEQFTQTITIEDNTAPVLTGLPADVTVNCADPLPDIASPSLTDDCDATTSLDYNEETTPADCAGNYELRRIWTATDGCGNSEQFTQTITIEDNTAPVLTGLPADVTVNCADPLPDIASPSLTDDCDATTSLDYNEETTPADCAGNYELRRIWTATDGCGNSEQFTQTITIEDNTAPVLTGLPADVTVNCADPLPDIASPSLTDDCDATTSLDYNEETTPADCAGNYELRRIWTATDGCGNSEQFTQTITIEDNTAPVLTGLPADVTVNCADPLPDIASPSLTDDCDANTSLDYNEETTPADCAGNYELRRIWTATDGCGNSEQFTQTITIEDNTAPVLTGLPADVTVNCADPLPDIASPSLTDDCDANTSLDYNEETTPADCAGNYELRRIWTATDGCGNSEQFTQTITIEDNTAPVLTGLPADVTVNCADPLPDIASPSLTDDCDANTSLDYNEETTPADCAGNYELRRIWTATDGCGNSEQFTQTITIEDNTAPVLTGLPADVTVNCADPLPDIASPSLTDDCDATTSLDYNEETTPADCAGNYELRRIWTATDGCGNSEQFTQTITIEDNTAPVLTGLPADVTVNCADPLPDIASPSLTDDCDATTSLDYNEETTPADCAGNYELRRIWTATDGCGNSEQFTQTITIEDNTAPVLTGLPTDVTVNCADPLPDIANPSLTDDCDATTSLDYNEETTPADCAGNYELRRIWTATDGCGNSQQFTQTITIEDNTAPVLTGLPADVTVNCADPLPDIASPSLTDDCDATTSLDYNEETTPADCAGNYELRRIWTATDGCGNSEQFTQTITVEDDRGPEFLSMPNDTTVLCSGVPSIQSPIISDECGLISGLFMLEDTLFGNGCPELYTIRRVWTITDDCGNSSQATRLITVEDYSAPIITDSPDDLTVECGSIPAETPPTFADGCTDALTITFHEQQAFDSCIGAYTLVRTWTAQDSCGNDTSFAQSIFVHNCTSPPTATIAPGNTICEGEEIQFVASIDNIDPPIYYQWQFSGDGGVSWTDITGATDSTYTIPLALKSDEGLYRIKIATSKTGLNDAYCNLASNEVILVVIEENLIDDQQNISICEGDSIRVGGSTYSVAGTFTDTLQGINGCDSAIVTLNLTINPVYDLLVVDTVCNGDSYQIGTSTYTQSGIYQNSLITDNGCDSLVTLDLTVRPENRTDLIEWVCYGESFTIGTNTYNASGNYSVSLTGDNGCDSLVTLDLTVRPENRTDLIEWVCYGESFTIGTDSYNASGNYSVTLTGDNGCDSLVTLDLTVRPENRTDLIEWVCYGESFTIGTDSYSASGNYSVSLTGDNGCDSLVTLDLTVRPENRTDLIEWVCYGESFTIGTDSYNASGNYSVSLTGDNGCDSLVTLDLTVGPENRTDLIEWVCFGESFTIGTDSYSASGNYSVTLTGDNGCDSLVTLDLTVGPENRTDLIEWVCFGESFTIGTDSYNASGNYSVTLTGDNGCDSLVTLDLTVRPENRTDLIEWVCFGESFTIGTDSYSASGNYSVTLTGDNGCDSLVTLDLTVGPENRTDLIEWVCYGESFTIGTDSYSASGNYSVTLTGDNGCDSLVTLDLTVRPENRTDLIEWVCYGESFTIGTDSYSASGNYSVTLTGDNGCDSLVTLDLTVRPFNGVVQQFDICQGDEYEGIIYISDATLNEVVPGSDGCDSTTTTHLFVHPQYSIQTTRELCEGSTINGTVVYNDTTITASHSSMFGCDSVLTITIQIKDVINDVRDVDLCQGELFEGNLYSNDTTLTQALISQTGCDSIVVRNLKIHELSDSNLVEAICFGESIQIGSNTFNTTGNYTVTLNNSFGCDSTVMLDLTVWPKNEVALAETICFGDSVLLGNTFYHNSGVHSITSTDVNGCDSTTNLSLTVKPQIITNLNKELCFGDSISIGNTYYSSSGYYSNTLLAADGCDSTVQLSLLVRPEIQTSLVESICEGSDYTVGSHTYSSTGIYHDTLPAVNGCDSLIQLDLTILPVASTDLVETICYGEAYEVGGVLYNSSGSYSIPLTGTNGCDSTVNLDLTILPEIIENESIELCQGESYNGTTYTQNATYTTVHPSISSCDSTVHTSILVHPTYNLTQSVSLCEGAEFNNVIYFSDTTIQLVGTSINGCDSINNFSINVTETIETTIPVQLCENELFNGANYPRDTIIEEQFNSAQGCDSVVYFNINVLPLADSSLSLQICEGESITVGTSTYSASGTYTDVITSSAGCDSTVNLQLRVIQPLRDTLTASLCQGDTYNGTAYNASTILTETLVSASGCDSIVRTEITVFDTFAPTLQAEICAGEFFAGQQPTQDTTITENLFTVHGCDSTVTTQLTVHPTEDETRNITLCNDQLYQGVLYTNDTIVVENLITAHGCERIVRHDIIVRDEIINDLDETICEGESITVGTSTYSASGTYTDVITSSAGCDSTVNLQLRVIQPLRDTLTASLCQGDTYNGTAYNASTILTETLVSASGCDSIVRTEITVFDTFAPTLQAEICAGEFFAGQQPTQDTTITENLFTVHGCDSTVTTQLTVHPTEDETRNITLCNDQLYQGVLYTNDTIVVENLITAHGCERIVRHDIIVRDEIINDLDETICEGESITVGTSTYSASGTYTDVITSSVGCDSTVNLQLRVIQPVRDTLTASLCQGDTYNGTAYNASTILTETLVSASGCDSIVRTEITVFDTFAPTLQAEICAGEFFAGQQPTQDTTITENLFTVHGCDSTVTTQLTVHPTEDETRNITLCNDQLYQGVLYTNDTIVVENLITAHGCERIIRHDIIVRDEIINDLDETICEGESITVGTSTYSASGTYTDVITSSVGCDSTVNLQLRVIQPVRDTLTASLCQGDTYNGTAYNASTILTETLVSASGCDSIVRTEITVFDTFAPTLQAEICAGEFFAGQQPTQDTTITENLFTVHGCDSTVTTQLTVHPTEDETRNITLCNDQLYQGVLYTNDTIVVENLITAHGCERIVRHDIIVRDEIINDLDETICEGESITVGTSTYSASGTYTDVITSSVGCDSTVNLQLRVIQPVRDTLTASLCQGDTYNGTAYNASTILTETLVSASGCDSIVRTEITVFDTFAPTLQAEICAGEFFAGQQPTQDTTITENLFTVHGCDSTVTTQLTVHPTEDETRNITLCNDQLYQGVLYTNDTIVVENLITAHGCERIVRHDIIVRDEIINDLDETICEGESITVGTSTYSASGTYTDVITSSAGCDSTVNLQLRVIQPVRDTLTASLCQGDTYNGTAYNASTILTETLVSASGCDSIVRTEITVFDTFAPTLQAEICAGEFFAGQQPTQDTTITENLFTVHGCDSTVTTQLTVHPTEDETRNITLCNGQLYQGVLYTNDTIVVENLITAHGCERIIRHDIIVRDEIINDLDETICEGESITVGTSTYSASGTYTDVITSSAGCDSTVNLQLRVIQPVRDTLTASLCQGDTYNGTAYNASTILTETLVSASGCDSIVRTEITVLPSNEVQLNFDICAGDSLFIGNAFQYSSGVFYDTLLNQHNCDSVIISNLTVAPCTENTAISVDVCAGDSLFVGGAYQTQSGVYTDTFTGINGQDSIITTTLTILPTKVQSTQVMICEGDSVLIGTTYHSTGGVFTESYQSTNGCDSIIITELIVHPSSVQTMPVGLCEGQTIFAGGAMQSSAGLYFDTYTNMYGCDSVVVTELTIHSNYDTLVLANICTGDSLLVGNTYYSQEGTYQYTYQTQTGCDSVVNVLLSTTDKVTTTEVATICEGDSILLEGSHQTQTGTYTDSFVSASGCDSVVVTELTVVQPYTSTITAVICEGETYFAAGQQQSTSGQYIDTIPDANGCKNIFITNLTVHPQANDTIRTQICQGDSILIAGAMQNSSGTFIDTLQSSNGCDSILVAILTVNDPSEERVLVGLCEGERYFAANAWQTTNGMYYDTLTTAVGCDSILATELVFFPTERTHLRATICNGDSMLIGGVYYSASGSYDNMLSDIKGCDSIVTVNLLVVDQFESLVQETICEGDSLFVGGAYQTIAGEYQDTYTSVAACDSIIITELLVEPNVELFTSDEYICYGEEIELLVTGADQVSWSPKTGLSCSTCPNPIATPSQTTTYTVSARTCLGASVQTEVTVFVSEAPDLFVPIQFTEIVKGDSVQLEAWIDDPNATLVWTLNGEEICRGCNILTVSPEQTKVYRVTVEGELGCSVANEITVRVDDSCKLSNWEIPNIISPNGDGHNDYFEIKYEQVTSIKLLRIYNRWGELVYETNDVNKPWDGSYKGVRLNPGVYIYYIEGVCLDEEDFVKTGNVTVLR